MVAAIWLCTCHILDMEEVMFKLVIAWVLFSSFLLTSCCFYYISRKRWTHAIMALSVPKIWSMRVCACVSVCVCCVCVFVCVSFISGNDFGPRLQNGNNDTNKIPIVYVYLTPPTWTALICFRPPRSRLWLLVTLVTPKPNTHFGNMKYVHHIWRSPLEETHDMNTIRNIC